MSNYLNVSFKESERSGGAERAPSSCQSFSEDHKRNNSVDLQRQQAIQNNIINRSNSVSRQYNNQSALSIMGASDPRKNDNTYGCLQIKKAEFFCSKANLVKHSHYLMRVFEKQDDSREVNERNAQAKIRLPDSTKADILIMFLNYIDNGKELPNKIDLYIAQNILLIAEALKMREIQRKFLLDILMPMLNRENVIFFTKMAYNKLSSSKSDENQMLQDDLESQTSHQDEEEFWFEFFSYALDLAASNVQFLIKMKSKEFLTVLEPSIVEEVIERAIRFYRADLQYDNTLLFDALMKVRKCDSIFQLLEQERHKIIESEQGLISNQENVGVKPTLTWRIQNLTGNFYRDSDPFMVENAQWKLSISYFKMEEEALSVQIKMVNNPFEVKKSKDYFKKKDFFLASNVAGGIQSQINPLEEAIDDVNLSQEEIVRRRKQIEQANAEYPSHAFITIVSSVRINQADRLSNPLVHTLICSAKTPALLKKFTNFKIDDYHGVITVEIYFKVKYIYSAILLYISKNFSYLITDPLISLMPKDEFKLLLKHKLLNVTQEDEVVKALCMWGEGQEVRANMDSDLIELLENVNWNFVSLQCILDLIRNFPYIRRNPTFHKMVNKEFAFRNKFNAETSILDPFRFSYKYNKASSNANANNKNSKNAKALLYVNHENFFQNLIDSMLEPVDIIKAHLVNEGINESSHRKQLELQLLQKKREINQIEEQLSNMRLMEDLCQRPDSRLKNAPFSYHMKQNTTNKGIGSEEADDVETVKNSMINLLNVGADENNARVNPARPQQLIEISLEAVQKMQQQLLQERQLEGDNQSNFQDMYNELSSIAKNNKIQIHFKSEEEDNACSELDSSDMAENEGLEYEEESYSEENKGERPSVVEVNNYQYSKMPSILKNHMLTSQSSRIVVGGATIFTPVMSQHQIQARSSIREPVQIKESKGIQTSIQQITSFVNAPKSYFDKQGIDQSIQMSFESPPEEPDMIQESVIHLNVDNDQDELHFLSNDASSVCGQPSNDHAKSVESLQQEMCTETATKTVGVMTPQLLQVEEKQPIVLNTNRMSVSQLHQFEQLKQKYQKKLMQEYTMIVQTMSKDVFDQNFLNNFQLYTPTDAQMHQNNLPIDRFTPTNNPQISFQSNAKSNNHFSPIQTTTPQHQVQVRNPKVHNLNISIHNNANYASPYPQQQQHIDTQLLSENQQYSTTDAQRFNAVQNSLTSPTQQQSYNTNPAHFLNQTSVMNQSMKIPLRNVKSPTSVNTTQSNTLASSGPSSNQKRQPLQKPPTVTKLKATSEAQQMIQHKIAASRPLSSQIGQPPRGNKAKVNLHIESNEYKPPNLAADPKSESMRGSSARYKGINLNSQGLTQYVNTMPNSAKNSQVKTQFNSQSAPHEKVVKSNFINKNQNKVIMQQLLNESGGLNGQMKIDPNDVRDSQTHSGPNIFWNTQQHNDQYSTASNNARSNEQLQNQIMRLIVEDTTGPFLHQTQYNQQQQPRVQHQNWIQAPITPSSDMTVKSFSTKRGSNPIVPLVAPIQTSYAANFNILDHYKHQVAMTPQQQYSYNTQQTPQQQYTKSFQKPSSAPGYSGSNLAINNQRQNYGNVVLDLEKLKVAAGTPTSGQNQYSSQYIANQGMINKRLMNQVELGTIQEQDHLLDSESCYNGASSNSQLNNSSIIQHQPRSGSSAGSLRDPNQSWHARKSSLQIQSSSNNLSQSMHNASQQQQYQAQSRCNPHDIDE